MRYVEAGGVRLSAIGLGTWQFGSTEWGYGSSYADTTAIDITRRALDLGVNLIDTAEIYGFGRSERIVGRAIAGRRNEAFLATKLFPVAPLPPVTQWRCRQSAQRLGVDTIDLYQLHWPNPVVPMAVQVDGLRRVLDDGLVRHVGVSNYSGSAWEAADQALGRPFLTNQVSYSLAAREPDADVVPYAQAHGRIVLAYSPLAQGFLSGRYDADHPPSGAARRANPLFLAENLEAGRPLLDALRRIAAAHDATPAQIALAWVIRRPNVVAIPGASSVEQLEKNVAASEIDLTDGEDAELTAASDGFSPRTGVAAFPSMIRSMVGRS